MVTSGGVAAGIVAQLHRLRDRASVAIAAVSAELTQFAAVIDVATTDERERLCAGVLAEIPIAPKAKYLPLRGARDWQRHGS
jgi:hypothetical protein